MLVSLVTALVADRPPLDVLVLRQPGTMFATLPNGDVSNFYNVQVFNRTPSVVPFTIRVTEPAGARVTLLGALASVGPHELVEGRLLLTVPASQASGRGLAVRLAVQAQGQIVQETRTFFVGPPRRSTP